MLSPTKHIFQRRENEGYRDRQRDRDNVREKGVYTQFPHVSHEEVLEWCGAHLWAI